MRNFETHSTEESLELYALGRLAEEKAESLEQHILICEECRNRLDSADTFVRAMRSGAVRLRREDAKKKSASAGAMFSWLKMPTAVWGTAALASCAVVAIYSTQLSQRTIGGAPITATLVAQRGEAMTMPAHHILNLTLDASGLQLGPRNHVELVDASGTVIQNEMVPEVGNALHTATRFGLSSGTYYVRVYAPGSSEPAREYALAVK